jgi:hypothetical protein
MKAGETHESALQTYASREFVEPPEEKVDIGMEA